MFLTPKNEKVYAVTRTSYSNGFLSFNISIEATNNETSKDFRLSLGQTEEWNGVSVTLTDYTTPPLARDEHFLRDEERIAHISDRQARSLSLFTCNSSKNAEDFTECTFPPNICIATPGLDLTRYDCVDMPSPEKILRNTESLLPSLTGEGVFLYSHEGRILARPSQKTARIHLTLNGFQVATQVDAAQIKIVDANLTGCYSCIAGALLSIRCIADHVDITAHVTCPSGLSYPIMCDTKGIIQHKRVHFNKAEINEECEAKTFHQKTNFMLKAHLNYAVDDISWKAKDSTGPVMLEPTKLGFDWQDLIHLVFGDWEHVMLYALIAICTVVTPLLVYQALLKICSRRECRGYARVHGE